MSHLKEIETRLAQVSGAIAARLGDPADRQRGADIAALWAKADALRDAYAEGLPLIHPKMRKPDDPPDDDPTLKARVDLMRNGGARLKLWPQMAALLARQADERGPWPLITERQRYSPKRDSDLTSYMASLLHHLANCAAHDRDKSVAGQHLDIGLSGACYVNLLAAARRVAMAQGRAHALNFLDVGCGGGSKVMIAAAYFDAAHGIEYNDVFAKNGAQALIAARARQCQITQDDATTFADYAAYDVIYFYRPISDPQLMAQLETKIVSEARPGTILIAPYPLTLGDELADQLSCIEDKIYVTGIDEPDAATLRDKAMQVGPDRAFCDPADAMVQGPFAPIIAASRLNGFAVPV